MKNRWLLVAVLFPVFAIAQPKNRKGKMQVISSVGFAAGESTAKPLIQLSGGLNFGRTYGGFGVGMDEYKLTSFPVFTDWRWSFGKLRDGFVYGNLGYNVAGRNRDKARKNSWALGTQFEGGLFTDIGVGYRLRFNPLHRLLFSAGFSQKNMRETIRYTTWCLTGDCPDQFLSYRYSLGRIVAKISWEFGK